MPLSAAAHGTPVSVAMLTDPKALKKDLANGNLQNSPSHSDSAIASARQSSEPPYYFLEPFYFGPTLISSRDDAYHVFDGNGLGKKARNTTGVSQALSSKLNPRQLLDPKGYNAALPKKHSDNATESDPGNGLPKCSVEDGEGQGMGNLIERVHNVNQREDRPRKRQKSEAIGSENKDRKKSAFAAGGKGGEIGEYMKQKRKQGQSSLGTNSVVDLTGGRYSNNLLSRLFRADIYLSR